MPIVQLYLDSYLNYDHKVLFRLSGIQTRIVGVEGEHADHLTTTTALICLHLTLSLFLYKQKLSMVLIKRPIKAIAEDMSSRLAR